MLNKIVKVFGGDPNKRKIALLAETADQANLLESAYEDHSDEALHAKTNEFRRRLAMGETLEDLLPEAFATVREASKRTIGLRHYDIQLIGGIALHRGIIAEMRTGEGKTLVATLPLYLNALQLNPDWVELARRKWGEDPERWEFTSLEGVPVGQGVHLVTVNDYLARRDARWMAPIYKFLGLSVGVLQMAARTENGKKAFLVDLEKTSPHEDQHQLQMVPRKQAYAADLTYGTTSEFGFDYLRDNMAMRLDARVQRGHYYAIIDEVDNVLIDEARTPLIISGPSHDDTEWYLRMAQLAKQLNEEDFEVDERSRTVSLTELGEVHVEEILGQPLRDPDRPEDITPEQERLLGYLEQALRAQFVFKRNKDYLVQSRKVIIVDENTGRQMPGRRWSDGLHQAIEAKEGVPVQRENVTYATITIQNYFRMYEKLSGMTGTAVTEAEEFDKIYHLDVLAIPTNLEYQASLANTPLIAIQDTDEEGYKYTYYTLENDPEKKPYFWKRKDYPDVVFRTEEAKFRAIGTEIMRYHTMGRPILVGTTSVELSERLAARLRAEPMNRLAKVLLLRHTWFEKNNREEDGRQVKELEFLNRPLGLLPPAEMRQLARELGISLNPLEEKNLLYLLKILGLEPDLKDRLKSVLMAGVPHQVLNARKHTEESQVIAGAGAFGAVTIATNMAGRGVDIKLGGELAEEIIAAVNRVIRRSGNRNPYDMTMEERQKILLDMDPVEYGIYDSEIQFFLKYIKNSEKVKELGGLHVIGSERHDSRRIDNQLRGRSGRQGDPGSSRFYLSMQDELMRLFGGQQAEGLMERLKIDDAMPIEMGMVSRIIEQSQTRVEGANFDTRKHLLEYDDVLNSQRALIYGQRDRIFAKDDLTDDVTSMLRDEIKLRVPLALQDEEGPWKLLAWLGQIQPPLSFGRSIFPSYPLKLLLEQLEDLDLSDERVVLENLLDIAAQSLAAEENHLIQTVSMLLDRTQDRLEEQLKERLETMDMFFEGLALEDETDTRNPRELQNELANMLRVPLKLSPEELRSFREDPDLAAEAIQERVESYLRLQTMKRVVIAVERRLEEPLDLEISALAEHEWEEFADQVLDQIEEVFARRQQRFLGEEGEGLIAKDLRNAVAQIPRPFTRDSLLALLIQMPQGQRATFDRRTRRRVWQRTTRFSYLYYTSEFLIDDEPALIEDILTHLEQAQQAIYQGWGASEFSRLARTPVSQLADKTRRGLVAALGEETCRQFENHLLKDLPPEAQKLAMDLLGHHAVTEVYRQLLLGVISELWVEYLTQMEALRVAIGLEAYAQRDPLVQYKSKASEMFQTLIRNTRNGVVTRMFTFRPRDLSTVTSEAKSGDGKSAGPQEPGETPPPAKENGHAGKRRRRRRRKKKKI